MKLFQSSSRISGFATFGIIAKRAEAQFQSSSRISGFATICLRASSTSVCKFQSSSRISGFATDGSNADTDVFQSFNPLRG